MSTGRDQPATSSARPVDLAGAWNASDADIGDRFHPLYRPALARLPDGPSVFRGLPFDLGTRAAGRRWILVDRELAIDLRAPRPREPSRHRPLRGQLARRERRSPARDARRLGLPDRRAARPLRDRARRRPDDRARRPAPVRDRRRDHRLGVPAVRGDRSPHRRDARLARPVSAPGRGSLRAGGPRRRADRPARLVGRQPDRGRRRGAVARRRRDVLAARDRAPAGRGAGPAARHAARRRPARDRRSSSPG